MGMANKKRREKAWKQKRKKAGGGARTPRRECGACTACCHAPDIPWLEKPEFTSCTHLKEGAGCEIYSTRPKGCRDFKCLWLAAPKNAGFLTEEDRPDKLGVMIQLNGGAAEFEGVDLWELRPGALESDRARRIRAALRARSFIITEARYDPEKKSVRRKLVTPTVEGKTVFIEGRTSDDPDNPTYMFGP